MVGSQSLHPPNPTFESKQTKFEEKFQTDFWFICHLQIKAVVTAVACQRPGRDRVQALFVISERMAGRGAVGGYGGSLGVHKGAERGSNESLASNPSSHRCPVHLSLNPTIVLLSPTFPKPEPANVLKWSVLSCFTLSFFFQCLAESLFYVQGEQ